MSLETITIVSGVQRSGTSMVMQMLKKGGLAVHTDNKRTSDSCNPKGYFEHSGWKTINKDKSIFKNSVGKGVKIYAGILKHLPAKDYQFKIIFIERDVREVWSSKRRLQKFNGKKVNDDFLAIRQRERMKAISETALEWTAQHPNIEVIRVDYNEILQNPLEQATRINTFLGNQLSTELMAEAVQPNLKKAFPKNHLVTDRAPVEITEVINEYAADKVYCEVGIGEGHNLNATTSPSKVFGVELEEYGVKRCKKLYPHIEVLHGDILKLLPEIDFEVCYMWITYPIQKGIIDAIFEKNENTIVLAGLNYFYHLDKNDEKAKKYMAAYPKMAKAFLWNDEINKHLEELKAKGFNHKIHPVTGENEEIFSIAAIQK